MMIEQLDAKWIRFFKAASLLAGMILIVGGSFVLAGWAFDIQLLKGALPGIIVMKPNAAAVFLLCGIGLFLLQDEKPGKIKCLLAALPAGAAMLLGAFTISEFLLNRDLGIDRVLFFNYSLGSAALYPGRIAFPAAINFLFLGAAFFLYAFSRAYRIAQIFIFTAGIIAFVVFAGYAYEVTLFSGVITQYTSMAVHAAFLFLVLSLGLMFARPDRGVMRIFSSDTVGGIMARRVLPAAIILPVVLGWMRLAGQSAGLYDASLGLLMVMMSNVMILGGIILWSSVRLYHIDNSRKSTEAVLRNMEERTRLIVETAYDAFVSINSQGEVINWNKQAEKIFGWSREEAIGKPMAEMIVPPQYREAHYRGLKRFLGTGEGALLNKRIEITAVNRGGREFPVEMTISPVSERGNLTFNAFLHDITDRRHAEEVILQKTAELARSKTELEQLELFAFAATHDLREPLHKIISLGDLLKINSASLLTEEGRNDLDRMRSAAKRMAQMFDQLRELSRIAADANVFQPVDLNHILKEVLSDLDVRIAEAKSVISADKLPVVKANPTQMRQLFQNLISNALKFRRKNEPSKVIIRSREFGRESVEITVEDNGIGFDEKYLSQLFKPFRKLHALGEYEGIGIGLAICHKIILHHGGKISAKSTPGKGSVFIFTLFSV